MFTRLSASLWLLAAAVAVTSFSSRVETTSTVHRADPRSRSAVLAELTAHFIANHGQWSGSARFAARRGGVAMALEPGAIRLRLGLADPSTVTLTFEGASPRTILSGEDRRPGVYNFIGGSRASWRTNVPAYASVLYRGMYDGIDVRVRQHRERFEYDLLAAPHADLANVVVRVDGARALELGADGALLVHTEAGVLRQTPPATLEALPDGATRAIVSAFRLIDAQRYGFEAPGRDASLPMVVDPGLIWSTLTGGTGSEQLASFEAARDGSGDLFLAGSSSSTDFATSPTPLHTSRYKAFVARIDASGAHYDFVTFINGLQNQTYPGGMAADTAGGVTLVGTTVDLDFPVTSGAFQTRFGSVINGFSQSDAFVLRLDARGAVVFGTYLGGSGGDGATSVAIAPDGALIVAGTTRSADFPTTAGAYDTTFNAAPAGDNTALSEDAFIARLTADGSQLTYGTYFGGQTYEVPRDSVVDAQGHLTIAGVTTSSETGRDIPVTADAFDRTWNGWEDGFIARFKLDGNGTADLKYSSFLGGVNLDAIEGIALDPTNPELVVVAGHAWVDMFTGPFFPTTSGVVKPVLTPNPPPTELFPHSKTGFVAKFRFPAAAPGSLVWSTFAGGNWEDFLSDVAVDETGAVIVAGGTRSYDLQTTRGAIDRTQDGAGNEPHDCFVWRLSANADRLLYSTFFGGVSEECEAVTSVGAKIAYLGSETIALAGTTGTGDFETTPGVVLPAIDELTDRGNPFVAKLALTADASGDLTVSPPTLLSPANNSVTGGFSTLVRFRWTAVTDPSGIEGYVYEISPRPDFPSGFTHYKGSVNSTELIIESMSINAPWYWRVRAADRAGNLSDWSATSSFTIGVAGGPPTVNYVQVYPVTVNGGSAAQGVLHLTDPAPPGGLEVTLTTRDPRGFRRTVPLITIPETVTIPAGAITANFPITTTAVAVATPAAIYATVGGVGAKGTLTVGGPQGPTAASLMLDPFVVTGGNPATGTVTLTGAAPAGGTVVPILSSHPEYAAVPASVTVPAGATSATFPIRTSAVPFAFDVTIAAAGGQFAARKLALKTPGPKLTSFTLSAANVSGGTVLTGTVTFSAPIPPSPFPAMNDAIVTVRSTSPVLGLSQLVAVPVGRTSATFSIGVLNVPVTTSLEVLAAYDDTVLRAPLTVQGRSATLASLTLNVSTLTGGQGGVGYVNLTAPAPVGHMLVNLSSSSAAISLPPNVTISEGTTTGLFAFNAFPVDSTTAATLTASYGPSSASAGVTINPASTANVWVTSLAVNPTAVNAGASASATVTLNTPAPAGGATVQLSSMEPATVPASVTIPAGSTAATFTVGTTRVAASTQAKIWALLNTTWGAVLTVNPGTTSPTLSALSLSPTSVTGGSSSQGTVTLSGAAPSGGAVVTLASSNNAVAAVPTSVTVPAGASSRTFTVTTQAVSSSTSVSITGTLGLSRSATLAVNASTAAPSAPGLIAPANGATVALPVTLDWNDVANAASYQIQVDDSNSFSSPFVVNQTVTTSQLTVTSLANRQHWWRVRGRNSAGTAGSWSSVRSFTPQASSGSAALSSVTIAPSSVTGGASAQGTATLTAAAPSGGAVIALSSSNAAAAVPAGVTIPAGATSATFSVTTRTVTTPTAVTLSGVYAGVTRAATLTVNPPPPSGTATLTVSATGRSGERVMSSPTGISVAVGSSGSASFAVGTSITLSVTNSRDAIWSGACSSGGEKRKTCTFTLQANASVTANVQ